jgi:hypothetical protein
VGSVDFYNGSWVFCSLVESLGCLVIHLFIFWFGGCFDGSLLDSLDNLVANYQAYWKNRPSQQLFKVLIYILFFCYMLRPSRAIFRWDTQLFS